MAPKSGTRGYLLLGDSFDQPRWRQAVVVKVEDGMLRTLVRCSQEELERAGLSSVVVGTHLFCLVEAEPQQLRIGAPSDAMSLEVEQKELVSKGRAALETGDDVAFASVSEPGGVQPQAKKKVPGSQSASSTEEEGMDVDTLQELRKSWLGSGLLKGKKEKESEDSDGGHRKSKKPFALIEKQKKKSSSAAAILEDKATSAAVKAALETGDPLQGLLALQLQKGLRSHKKKKHHRRRTPSSSDTERSGTSSSSSARSRGEKGHARAVGNYRREGKRKFRKPLKHVRRFIESVEEELGAQGKPFRLTDHNRRIHFGKQQNLKRCHYLVCIILEWLLREEPHKAALQAVLTLQSMHQAAIDGGWDVAWLLTHVEEPFKTRLYGGDPSSLEHVTAYVKSMNELTRNTANLRQKGAGKGEGEENNTSNNAQQKGKGRGDKGAKDKEKEKSAAET